MYFLSNKRGLVLPLRREGLAMRAPQAVICAKAIRAALDDIGTFAVRAGDGDQAFRILLMHLSPQPKHVSRKTAVSRHRWVVTRRDESDFPPISNHHSLVD